MNIKSMAKEWLDIYNKQQGFVPERAYNRSDRTEIIESYQAGAEAVLDVIDKWAEGNIKLAKWRTHANREYSGITSMIRHVDLLVEIQKLKGA